MSMDPSLSADRILVVRLDAVGDCVLSSSFFTGLRTLYPDAHITAILSPETVPLYADGKLFDRILHFQGGSPETSSDRLTDWSYDIAISPRWDADFQGARLLLMKSGAPVRIGFDRGTYAYNRPIDGVASDYLTHIARSESTRHEVLKSWDLLRFIDPEAALPSPRLFVGDTAAAAARRFVDDAGGGRYAVLGVSAQAVNRRWPVENFMPVIDRLAAAGLRCIVVGGPDAVEAGQALTDARPGTVASAAGALDLMASAGVIAGAFLFVGMDSAPMHMAAASGVPVVEISCHPVSGGADHYNAPARFGPFATRNQVCQPPHPLPPCVDGCQFLDRVHCITLVSPADVVGAIDALLNDPEAAV